MSATPERTATGHPVNGSPSGFRPDIQGLRAVAVLAVVLHHAGVSILPGGYAGVDVFFVISGFLITNHLLSMLRAGGTIPLTHFYSRRIRRILPAALAVLILTAVASLMFVPRVDVPGTMHDAAATALYVPNLLFAVEGTDYLAETSPSPFQHYWSLGIEEQFYLLWPLILLGAFLAGRRVGKRFGTVLAGVVAASFICNLVLLEAYPAWAFFSLPSRAWELGVGALVACAICGATRALPAWAGGSWYGAVLLVFSPASCSLRPRQHFRGTQRCCPSFRPLPLCSAEPAAHIRESLPIGRCRRSAAGPTRFTLCAGRC